MANGMSMKVLLQLQTKEFQKGINSIKKQLTGFQNFIKSTFALGSVTMFGKQMVQVSKDFEDAMARVQAVSNATSDEFKKMRQEAEKLGSTTRYTASQAASALENLTRNGMSAAQATKALSDVLALAQANSIELSRAADIMTNTLNMFGLSVNSATKASDILSSTASHAATDIDSLYEALVNAAPAANALGFSLEETSSAIGALAQRGVKGSEAGTKLRTAFQKMADPKVVAKLKAQGIEIDENTMKAEGLYKTVEKLAKANLSLGQMGSIFDAKSAMAVQLLVSSIDDLNYMLDVTAKSAGETNRMMQQGVGTVQRELDTLKSKYEGLLISIGSKTSGVVKGAIKLLQNLIGNFETVGGTIMNIASIAVPLLTKRVITLGATLRTMFAQAAAGAATLKAAMGGIVSVVATLVVWIGTSLVGAWNKANKEMRDATAQEAKVRQETNAMKREVDSLIKKIGDGTDRDSVNGAVAKAIKLFPEFENAIRSAAAEAARTGNWEKLKGVLQDIANLQGMIAQQESDKAMYEARVGAVANKMVAAGKRRQASTGAARGGVSDNNQLERQIRDKLKEEGFDESVIKQFYRSLVKNMTEAIIEYSDNGDNVRKVDADKIKKTIEDAYSYGVFLTEDEIYSLFDKYLAWHEYDSMSERTRRSRVTAAPDNISARDTAIAINRAEVALKLFHDKEKAEKELLHSKEKSESDFNNEMSKAAEELRESAWSIENLPDSKRKQMLDEAARYTIQNNANNDNGGNASKVKTATDLIKDAIDDYNENVNKLGNRFEAGTITLEEYNSELAKLADKTWETITAFDNFEAILEALKQTAFGANLKDIYSQNRQAEADKKSAEEFKKATDDLQEQFTNLAKYLIPPHKTRDTRFDYAKTANDIANEELDIKIDAEKTLKGLVEDLEEAIKKGNFNGIKDEAIDQLEALKEALKSASGEAETLQHKLNYANKISALQDEIKELKDKSIDNISSLSNAFDNLYRSIQSIADVFGEEIEWEGFEKMMSLVNASVQIFETFKSIIEAVKTAETLAAKQKEINAAKEVMANAEVTASEVERGAAQASAAVAGGASSVASIPYVGPALAVAAAAAITTAILAGMSKFANGGFVNGPRNGDQNVIRANGGEYVMTTAQQQRLLDIFDGKTSAGGLGGKVEFEIRGDKLKGVLKNYERVSGR